MKWQAHTDLQNDSDGFISNFWRCLALGHADTVARYADWPVNENDLHARHYWLVQQAADLQAQLEGDPDYCDPKIAGWWVWGICAYIGSGWCSGRGPWHAVDMPDGTRRLMKVGNAGQGINRQLPHLGNAGRGINRQRPQLGNGGSGQGILAHSIDVYEYMCQLANRLRRVRVASGDWSRVCGRAVTYNHGLTGVFLDPPYAAEADRADDLYRKDCKRIAHDARKWCLENGNNPLMRIILCGYEEEHAAPLAAAGWRMIAWDAGAGYSAQRHDTENVGVNGKRERLWLSPHCLPLDRPMQATLL
ncbi:MAG: RsmD family RNA methyltransferase [Anaerolineae bacterium]|nr:RsmD family RNA methyltransferase [Anaerolineae bacterium]